MIMPKRAKKAFVLSLDWALVVLLALSMGSSAFTIYRFRRFSSDSNALLDKIRDDLMRENDVHVSELRALVGDFVGRSPNFDVVSSSSTNLAFSSLASSPPPLPSALPDGLWVASKNGEWRLTDGVNSYLVGSVSPIGTIDFVSAGVVRSECGTFYSLPRDRGVKHE